MTSGNDRKTATTSQVVSGVRYNVNVEKRDSSVATTSRVHQISPAEFGISVSRSVKTITVPYDYGRIKSRKEIYEENVGPRKFSTE